MSRQKSSVRTLNIRQIKKNVDLTMGTPQKDIAKYEKVISSFGNVTPAIVASNDGMFDLIDGHARLEAYLRAGVNDIPVVIAKITCESEQLKLSLLLSSSREQSGALGEGALIEKLIKEYGYTLGELSELSGRSKAWLSKRQTLVRDLSPIVKNMIHSGMICTRSAEEVAKLPRNEQAKFAAGIVKENLNKDEVVRLIRLYRSYDATPALRRAIIDAPAKILKTYPRTGERDSKSTGDRRILGAVYYVMNLLDEFSEIVCEANKPTLAANIGCLLKLRGKMYSLINLIDALTPVSPGKQGGEKID